MGEKKAIIGGKHLGKEIFTDKQDKKKKWIKRSLIVVGCLLVVVIVLLLIFNCSGWFDKDAQWGYYDGKTQEEIQHDLDMHVEEGQMNVSIAHTVKFPNGTEEVGSARIENKQANHVDQKVAIILKSNNKCIYESGAIAPGYYIDEITSSEHLDPGMYEATAVFTGYDRDSHTKQGSIACEIQIQVE